MSIRFDYDFGLEAVIICDMPSGSMVVINGVKYVPERTCHMTLKKSGPYYDVWYFDCCEKEWAEPRCDSNIVDYPGFVCPWCGAKVVV